MLLSSACVVRLQRVSVHAAVAVPLKDDLYKKSSNDEFLSE